MINMIKARMALFRRRSRYALIACVTVLKYKSEEQKNGRYDEHYSDNT
jgi:hypothetical protein